MVGTKPILNPARRQRSETRCWARNVRVITMAIVPLRYNVSPVRLFRAFTIFAAVFCLPGSPARAAATLVVTPNTASGRIGETIQLRGAGFPPSATLIVAIGGAPTAPSVLVTDAAGTLAPVYVAFAAPVPGGRQSVLVAAGAATPIEYKQALTIRPVLTLDPPIGDGRAGSTWRTNKAVATGGYFGMVFTLNGSGLAKDTFIPADAIRIGRAATRHDPIRIGEDGILPSTTIVVAADLPPGRYDLLLPLGASSMNVASAYNVAPWAATDTLKQRGAGRALDAARKEIKELVRIGGELLPAEELADLDVDVKSAEADMKAGNFENAEDLSRQIHDKLEALGAQVASTRKEKMKSFADVIASGFDTIQPEGAPAPRQGGAAVAAGRQKLAEAQAAIAAAKFDDAKSLMKEANELLKKARAEAGVQTGTESEPIRW